MLYLSNMRKRELAAGLRPTTQGDLTYMLTLALVGDPAEATLDEALQAAVDSYIDRRQPTFGLYCDVMGALTCALAEYERRLRPRGVLSYGLRVKAGVDFLRRFYSGTVAPFLDTKLEQNGDVYPYA